MLSVPRILFKHLELFIIYIKHFDLLLGIVDMSINIGVYNAICPDPRSRIEEETAQFVIIVRFTVIENSLAGVGINCVSVFAIVIAVNGVHSQTATTKYSDGYKYSNSL